MKSLRNLTEGILGDRARFLLIIVFFQLLVDAVVAFDIPIARQILGLVYLTFVPGTLIIRLLGMSSFDSLENFLFSIGLSVAFVMFLALMVNQVGLFLGLGLLSTPILILAMNGVVFSLCVLCIFLRSGIQSSRIRLDLSLTWIFFVCFPFLAILGTTLVNSSGNSAILLLMIGLVALTIMVISAVKSRTNLALTLFMITIAVLLQTSLISHYIVGYDVHPAYHVFRITQDRQNWISATNETDPLIPRSNQMLSVTVLPVVYSNILNLEGTWIFKIVYPLLLAFVPVGLYRLYQKHVEKKAAFVGAFFILADITFIAEMPGLPAQIVSEFFLTLLLILLFQKEISQSKKISLFAVFSMGLIVSHYGVSYIFMFLMFLSWLFLFIGRKQTRIKLSYVILLFVLAFSWYIYTAQSASFETLLDMGQHVSSSFWTDFFNPESRTENALASVGLSTPVSAAHWIGRAFHYATQLFIVLGVVSIFLRKEALHDYDYEYVLISVLMLGFALAPLIAPSFNLLNVPRTYHLSLLFLAPFCIIGGDFFFSPLFKILRRKRLKSYVSLILTSVVVVSLFLFESGFFYEVTEDVSYSVPLSKYRLSRKAVYGSGYLSESFDVFGALWLRSAIVFSSDMRIYGDVVSVIKSPLTSYAALPPDHMQPLSNVTSFHRADEYVYLRNFNTRDGKILGELGREWNTTDLWPLFQKLNKIYDNDGSEIYKGTP